MKNNKKKFPRELLFFLIGFVGFQLIWNFVLLPLIVK